MRGKTFNIKSVMLGCLLGLFLFSCTNEDHVSSISNKTLLVYMIAENSLTSYAEINIDSIASGLKNSTDENNILIYVDTRESTPELIRLSRQSNGKVTKSIIKSYPEQNSVSPSVMASVLKEMAQEQPSRSYGLILWSHGYGWLPANNNTKTTTRWFGQDGSYFMDIPDLVAALDNSGIHFSCITFDACFMGSIETCYALRNCTDYIIASPSEILAAGFPYQTAVPYLLQNIENDYKAAAASFYNFYQSKKESMRSATISCIKCSELESLAIQMRAIVNAHATALRSFDTSKVQYLEGYSPHLFYDLGSYVKNFATPEEQEAFEKQLNKIVIYKAYTDNILSATSWGNVYIPVNAFSGFNTYIWTENSSSSTNASYQKTEWYAAVYKAAFDANY